jgi:nucleotide-binding universal stress UspA family protein
MFKHVLVPLDGSLRAERALPLAARIVRVTGGSITLLRVVTTPDEFGPFMRQSVMTLELRQAAIAMATKYLSGVAASHALTGIDVKTAVFTGLVSIIILDTAREQQSDLIVLASHGTTGLSRWMLGSVAQKIARSSPIPVLVVRDGGNIPISPYPDLTRPLHTMTAAVALDGSPVAEATILPAADLVHTLAAPAKGSLHLTRIVQLPQRVDNSDGQRQIHSLGRETAIAEAEEYLYEKTRELHENLQTRYGLGITWSVKEAHDITQGLISVAEHGNVDRGVSIFGGCDMLAMATHGRSGLQRITLGSVTEQVLGRTLLPLLIVRPQHVLNTHVPGEAPQQAMTQVQFP